MKACALFPSLSFSVWRLGCRVSMTPVWVRRRVWKCFISSGEFCTKWCQLTMRPSGYQSNVSNKDYCASSFRKSWGFWNGLGWLWCVSSHWGAQLQRCSNWCHLTLNIQPEFKRKQLPAAAVITTGQFPAPGSPLWADLKAARGLYQISFPSAFHLSRCSPYRGDFVNCLLMGFAATT